MKLTVSEAASLLGSAEDQVYDWMISWSDGRMEGGYTVEVLRRRGGEMGGR